MKTKITCILLLILLIGCSAEEEEDTRQEPKSAKLTADVSFDADNLTINLSGTITLDGYVDTDIKEFGFLYKNDFINDNTPIQIDELSILPVKGSFSQFTAKVPLRPQNVWICCLSYFKTKSFIYYSDISYHKISGSEISVKTSSNFSGLTYERATVYGSCYSGNPEIFPIKERGFCYINTHEISGRNPNINDAHLTVDAGEGDFSATITGLKPGAAYKVRAYAINLEGIEYSNSYVTLPMYLQEAFVPSCIIRLDSYNSVIHGEILSDNEYDIIEKGFCYNSLGKKPTIDDTKITCGKGIGSFEYDFTKLPTGKYYFRSYAINQAGCGYSYLTKEIIIP